MRHGMMQYIVGLSLEEQRRPRPRSVGEALRPFGYVTVIGKLDNPYVRVAVPDSRATEFSRALPKYVIVEPYDQLDLL